MKLTQLSASSDTAILGDGSFRMFACLLIMSSRVFLTFFRSSS